MIEWIADKLLPPAIVAVIFSYLTNMFLESHRAQRDFLTTQVSTLREDLLLLWEEGADYWGHDQTDGDAILSQKILLLEQDIRFRAMEIAPRLESIGVSGMKTFLADISDAFTGGDFGANDKSTDLERIARMRKVIVYMRDALLTARNAALKNSLRRGH